MKHFDKTQEENRKLLNKVDKSNAIRAEQAASNVLSLKVRGHSETR